MNVPPVHSCEHVASPDIFTYLLADVSAREKYRVYILVKITGVVHDMLSIASILVAVNVAPYSYESYSISKQTSKNMQRGISVAPMPLLSHCPLRMTRAFSTPYIPACDCRKIGNGHPNVHSRTPARVPFSSLSASVDLVIPALCA